MYDYATISNALEEIVNEYGADYVYERPEKDEYGTTTGSCLYVHHLKDGRYVPGCIIGHLLVRLGEISMESFPGTRANGLTVTAFLNGYSRENLREEFTVKARTLMTRVQEQQDAGDTWGKSLEYGRNWVKDYNENGYYVHNTADAL